MFGARFVNRTILPATSLVLVLACQGALAAGSNRVVTGSTLFPPLTNSDVTLRVGAEHFAATTDAQGDYSLEVPTPGADALISLEIQGTGAQSHFRYARMVGQWSDLETATTGTDAVDLGPTSPLSTVLYVLVEARSGGSLPVTFPDIEPLTRTMETGDVESMMLVLAAIEQDLVQPGTGTDNTLDMLRDPQEVVALSGQIVATQESSNQAWAALRQQFNEPRLYRPKGAVADRLETAPAELGSSDRTLIDFENGTPGWLGQRHRGGAITRETDLGNVIWADRFSLGELEQREWVFWPAPGSEIVYRTGMIQPEPNGDAVPYRDLLNQLTWRTLDASASFDLADTKVELTRSYPDNPELPPESITWDIPYDIVIALRYDRLPVSWPGPQAGSTWALPLCAYDFTHSGSPAYQGPFGHDFVTLNGDGTASTRRAQLNNLQWSLQDSVLTLTADNAPQARLRYIGSTSHGDLLAATCRDSTGEPRALTARAVPVATVPAFDTLDLPVRFISGLSLNGYLPSFSLLPEFGVVWFQWVIELDADGTGQAGYLDDPFDTSASPGEYILQWTQLTNGRVEIHMEHPFVGSPWAQSRSWLPIATEGDDMLFIESLFLAPQDELGDELTQPGRFNWYRMVGLPGSD